MRTFYLLRSHFSPVFFPLIFWYKAQVDSGSAQGHRLGCWSFLCPFPSQDPLRQCNQTSVVSSYELWRMPRASKTSWFTSLRAFIALHECANAATSQHRTHSTVFKKKTHHAHRDKRHFHTSCPPSYLHTFNVMCAQLLPPIWTLALLQPPEGLNTNAI